MGLRSSVISAISLLITFSLSVFRQRVEIVAFLLQQSLLHQALDSIKNCGTRLRIVFTSLKESVQIELLSVPEFKAFQNAFVDFIHGGSNGKSLGLLLFHVSHHRFYIRRDSTTFRVEQRRRWWQSAPARFRRRCFEGLAFSERDRKLALVFEI